MAEQNRQHRAKKLLYISAHFPPCAASGVYRTLGFLENLVPMGWSVTVLALKNIREERIDPNLMARIPAKVRVLRTGYLDPFVLKSTYSKHGRNRQAGRTGKPQKTSFANTAQPSFLHRCKESISYLLKTPDNFVCWIPVGLFRAAVSGRPDVIFATAPPFSSLVLAVLLKKIWRRPLVIDLRDPWSQNPFRLSRPKSAEALDRFLERWVFGHADHILMNTKQACILYQRLYPDKKQDISALTNGFDPVENGHSGKMKHDPSSIWIVYVGALYGKRSPGELLAAARGVRDIIIDLFGPGTEQYRDQVTGTPVRLHPPVDHNKAVSLQQQADITLIIGNCMAGSVQIPAKIFEAMSIARRLWLIDTEDSPARQLLRSHGIPHFFSSNQADAIAATLKQIQRQWRNGNLDAEIDPRLLQPFRRKNLTRKLDRLLSGFLPTRAAGV